MPEKKGIFSRIATLEALRAFLEQWQLWAWVVLFANFAWSIAVTWWAALSNVLPGWALAFVFATAVLVGAAITTEVYSTVVKRKESKMFDRIVHIDRDALADEMDKIAHDISALVAEHSGTIQEAWRTDAMSDDIRSRANHTRAEGKLIEKFGERFQAKAYSLIRRASKVVQINRSDHWRIEHGIRSTMDLTMLSVFIAQLADDVRNPVRPIPMYEEARVAPKQSQQPSSTESEMPPRTRRD